MKEMKGVILEHYHRYPKLNIEDLIKLIYQNSFGPKHMNSNPSLDSVIQNLKEELLVFNHSTITHQVEHIGNDYYRVSLSMIDSGLMSIEDLAEAFYHSMLESPIVDDDSIKLFVDQLDLICDLINKGMIDLKKEKCNDFIESYLDRGIRPISHSDIYRQNYFPHYRLIHKSILQNYIEVV